MCLRFATPDSARSSATGITNPILVFQALKESTYPFLAVIVLRQNKMMVVGRMEGFVDNGSLLPWLEKTIRDNEAFIVAARVEREERAINQNIRQEQVSLRRSSGLVQALLYCLDRLISRTPRSKRH